MRIAITGGDGFLGSATVQYAKDNGYEMFSFDHARGDDILGSLSSLTLFGPDAVIHLAGVLGTHELFESARVAEDAVGTNVIGTLRILDWCRHNNASFTGITMPAVFPSVYTATKMCADRLATAWHREFGVPVSKVRAYNVFGAGQKFGPGHPQKIIPAMSVAAWRGEPVPVWGDGTQTVDLIHVDDVARVLVAATGFGNNEIFDAGSGVAYTVKQVAELVLEVTGSQAGIEYLDMRRGEIPTQIKSESAGWEKLGDSKPFFQISTLIDTIRSYKALA